MPSPARSDSRAPHSSTVPGFGTYILDTAGAKSLNRSGYEPEELPITPQMVEAGAIRLGELQGQVASAYLVEEVYLAMAAARDPEPRCGQDVAPGKSSAKPL